MAGGRGGGCWRGIGFPQLLQKTEPSGVSALQFGHNIFFTSVRASSIHYNPRCKCVNPGELKGDIPTQLALNMQRGIATSRNGSHVGIRAFVRTFLRLSFDDVV